MSRWSARIGTPAATAALALLGLTAAFAPPALPGQTVEELRQMSLEELMSIQVTTVTRSAERASLVPAAVYVITPEDIRRSGATSLPELLRLAPGMQVARIDAGKWSVGMRGFADRLSRSMLVLIDGRAVYSPLFAGTYWETQDVPLEDIERIEVIRGPGGTLWGSNAVNGIVSVVTRSADETQGLWLHAATGSEQRLEAAGRYGVRLGDFGFLRGWARGFDVESQFNTGELEYDGWRFADAGFRMDAGLGVEQELTVQGGVYTARLGEFVRETSLQEPFVETYAADRPLHGGNLLARWIAPVGDESSLQLQTFYDRTEREEYPVSETRETFDVDFQGRHQAGRRHHLVWGLGWRLSSADITTAPTVELPGGSENLFSAFVQDEVSVADDRLRLTGGVKLEHNDYSGLEVMPSARAAWLVNRASTVWGAVTRAVRRPSRVERNFASTSILDPSTPAFVRLIPNPGFEPEKLVAYEAGYRTRPHRGAYLTLAAFYNVWDDLLSTELLGPPFTEDMPPDPERQIFPVTFRNGLDGRSYGLETTVDLRPVSWWRIAGHYAFLRVDVEPSPGSEDLTQESRYEGGSPRHQVRLQNSLDLPGAVTFDWHLRYVAELPDLDIASYTTSDVRLAWRATDALELEVVGRNLHAPHHAQWIGDNGGADVEIQRGVYVGVTWRR